MSHTPGPWKASSEPSAYPVCVVEHENCFYNWYVNVDGPTRQDPESDAHLIAAAPELLEGCESAMEWAANFPLGIASTLADTEAAHMVYRKCAAAIAKAKRGDG